jgi:hypothetical protein
MGFKLKSGNKPNFKGGVVTSAFKTPEEGPLEPGIDYSYYGETEVNKDGLTVKTPPPAKETPKDDSKDTSKKTTSKKASNATWKAGDDKAKKETGVSLNELVKQRKGLEKGSNEWNKVQNKINSALGNSYRHDVTDTGSDSDASGGKSRDVKKTDGGHRSGGTTTKTKTRKDGTTKKVVTKTPDSKTVTKTNRRGETTTRTKDKNYRQRSSERKSNKKKNEREDREWEALGADVYYPGASDAEKKLRGDRAVKLGRKSRKIEEKRVKALEKGKTKKASRLAQRNPGGFSEKGDKYIDKTEKKVKRLRKKEARKASRKGK